MGDSPLNEETMFQCAEFTLDKLQEAIGNSSVCVIDISNIVFKLAHSYRSTDTPVFLLIFHRSWCYTGEKTLAPMITAMLNDFLERPDWKYRYVALMAAAQVTECFQTWKRVPSQYVLCVLVVRPCRRTRTLAQPHLLPATRRQIFMRLKDPHPRVVYGAIHCIGMFADDFAPKMQLSTHSDLIPALLHLLLDFRYPKVQQHAAAALYNFLAGLDYYEQVMSCACWVRTRVLLR